MLSPPQVNRLEQFQIRQSQRSWWQVQYASGKVISEWATLQLTKLFSPLGPAASSRWEEISKLGIRGIYLLCPNGKAGALESGGEYTFFQMKVGFLDLGAGTGQHSFLKQPARTCKAHIIGKVDGEDGHCVCYAWEYDTQQLVRFEDSVVHMAYQNIGAVNLGHHTGVL